MKVRVQYTAQLRTALGRSEEEVDLPDGSTVALLIAQLALKHEDHHAIHLLAPTGELAAGLLVILNDVVVARLERQFGRASRR